MAIILIIAMSISTPLSASLLKNASHYAQDFHKKCLHLLPQSTLHPEALAALTCGQKITQTTLQEALSKTSLIHIFIVSGSHLILLDQLLSIFKIPSFLRFLLLSIYSLAVGWQAPAVRALIGLGAKQLLRHSPFHFPTDLIVLITGLITLTLFPSWWSSLSLQMSWCAALALSLPGILRLQGSWQKVVFTQITVMFFMSVPLWGLGSLHPLSLIYNIFLGPLVAYLLLPLSILSLLFHPLVQYFDFTMSLFNFALPKIIDPIELKTYRLLQTGFVWMWIFSLHLALHFLRLKRWQGRN